MEFRKLVEERRSVHFFDPSREIEEDVLKDIIDIAVKAPSCFNTQPWEIIIVSSEEGKKDLYNRGCQQPKVLDAPVTLVVVGKKHGYSRSNPIWDVKIENGLLNEEQIIGIEKMCNESLFPTEEKKTAFAVRNSSLLAMSLMYSAKNLGVDSHPMIGFDEDEVKKLYNIKDDEVVTMLICLGHFDKGKNLYPREKRYGYDEIVRKY